MGLNVYQKIKTQSQPRWDKTLATMMMLINKIIHPNRYIEMTQDTYKEHLVWPYKESLWQAVVVAKLANIIKRRHPYGNISIHKKYIKGE